LRKTVADARVPVAQDPRQLVKWQITRRKYDECARRASTRRIDGNDLGMRHGRAHERAMRHVIEMNIINKAGSAA
jgi:hypothetical protein